MKLSVDGTPGALDFALLVLTNKMSLLSRILPNAEARVHVESKCKNDSYSVLHTLHSVLCSQTC